jgi:hypothetical protein
MVGMDRRLIEAIERWFRLPRVVLLYIALYVVTAAPMFTSDPDNPARAFSFALMLWISLTVVSAVVAMVTVGVVASGQKKRLIVPIFNATFVVTWIVLFSALMLS